jgi:hypothetical protein
VAVTGFPNQSGVREKLSKANSLAQRHFGERAKAEKSQVGGCARVFIRGEF